jgi:AraC-like DNA-binding protein
MRPDRTIPGRQHLDGEIDGGIGGTAAGASGPEIHAEAVARAIRFMRQRLGEPQELRDMAEVAFLSPFHFHRVFRATTGAPPGRFLTALRMATAKSLLLETKLSATTVSTAVGYSSFGTFTTQFTRLVGVAPGRFRAFTARVGDLCAGDLARLMPNDPDTGAQVRGWVGERPDQSKGVTLIGLFVSGIPQERPQSCTLTVSPGPVALPCAHLSGDFAALAFSVRWDATVRETLIEDSAAGLYVGAHATGVRVSQGRASDGFSIPLRAMRITDPPVLSAYPLLLLAGRDELHDGGFGERLSG